MAKIRLNHIGIAATDLSTLEKLFGILGLRKDHMETVLEQGVRTHFLPVLTEPMGSHLELLEPIDARGTVAQFIAKRGPGIHHISFTVEAGGLDAISQKLREGGFRLIYDQPKVGAHGMQINFIHPSSAGGMLIELMEAGQPQS